MRSFKIPGSVLITLLIIVLFSVSGLAQSYPTDTTYKDTTDTGFVEGESYPNMTAGEFTPGKGFDLVKTKYGSLNLSLYAMVRYLNQLPGESTWTNFAGTEQTRVGRNDFFWHRSMLWFSGFVITKKLRYQATVWTVMTTQQTLLYGQLFYTFNKHFVLGAGIIPNLSIRTMQGPFPFYSSTDRTMAEESIRGGFTNGILLSGEIVPKLRYTLMLGNNLSTLGVQAARLTRDLASGASLVWMPTTGEFGPRGGNMDFENHEKLATRFGVSYNHSREDRFNNIGTPSPDNTQVRGSDGMLFFETGAVAPGVTIDKATYDLVSVDLGFKYRGFALQTEFYSRNLSDFVADGPLPYTSIRDNGMAIQPSYMIIPKKLNLYGVYSMLMDEYGRDPWELGGGLNFYPVKSRTWRINAQVMSVNRSSAGGTFGLYQAGQTGTTLTIGTDILL